jgi:large subunit ribosomal protein L17
MRHNKKFNHLGRKSAHRKAMLSNMATSLIIHKRIKTTEAKAKALKMYVEPLITKSKEDTTHNRRTVFAYLRSKEAVTELFRDISLKVADRPGGYTRIIKLGKRLGDNAEICMIELVDYNEHMLSTKETKKKSRRSRRGGKKTTQTNQPTADAKVEQVEEDAPVVDSKQDPSAVSEAKSDEAKEEKPETVADTNETQAIENTAAADVKDEPVVTKEDETPTSEVIEEKASKDDSKKEEKPASDEEKKDNEKK